MTTSVMWLGQLFAMMCLAVQLCRGSYDELLESLGGSSYALSTFQMRTAQCLTLGKYAKPKAHTIQALIVHLQCRFMGTGNADVNVSVISGIIVRLAMYALLSAGPQANQARLTLRFLGVWVTIEIRGCFQISRRSKARCDGGYGPLSVRWIFSCLFKSVFLA